MSKRSTRHETAEQHVKSIRRATRKQYSAEEKIRVVLEGLRGEQSIAELCRREGIAQRQLNDGNFDGNRENGRLSLFVNSTYYPLY